MFEEFEKVRIKASGVIGTIVDKITKNGKARYIVEDDKWRDDEESIGGGEYPLYNCVDEDLVRV